METLTFMSRIYVFGNQPDKCNCRLLFVLYDMTKVKHRLESHSSSTGLYFGKG